MGNKHKLKTDLHSLFYDLKNVYPLVFKMIVKNPFAFVFLLFLLFVSLFFDETIRTLFFYIHNAAFDYIFSFGHWYGNGGPTTYLFILFYFGGIVFSNDKVRDRGLLIAESFIFTGLITLILKSALGRWRPFTEEGSMTFSWLILGPNDYLSMPSGHATTAFALSSILAGTTNNNYLKTFYYLLAVITAISRIYHDQHWFSDIFVSAVNGILIGTTLVYIHKDKAIS